MFDSGGAQFAVQSELALLPRASAIMVVYHTGPALQESLQRVLIDEDAAELIIVDNGSSDEERAWIDAASASSRKVRVIRGHGNVGFAKGCNLGARLAKEAGLFFLNPDAFLSEGCISSLMDCAESRASPCLVGARIVNPDGTEQRGGRRGEVTPVTTILSILHLADVTECFRKFEIHQEATPAPTCPIEVPTISGAGFYISRSNFFSLGGFDEDYFLHVEDIDLCWRVRQAGGSVWFNPGASIVHLGSTSASRPLVIEFWKGIGLTRYFVKRSDTMARFVIAWLIAPAVMAASIARGLRREGERRERRRKAPALPAPLI